LQITREMPPTFLAQGEDDGVRVETSIFSYAALRKASVPAEMHRYPVGDGYGPAPPANSSPPGPSVPKTGSAPPA
jgi:acetyl esterase/lipase